jgi:hypothetical protein
MTPGLLTQAHMARPFRPFAIRLADGRTLPVSRPSSLAFNGKGQAAVVMDEGDGFEFVDLTMIADLDFEGETSGGR